MKQHEFDLDGFDRRTPYRVPEGYFAGLEERIAAGAARRRSRRSAAPRWRAAAAVAAAAVVAAVFTIGYMNVGTAVSLDVDDAFSSLSLEDQDYLVEAYGDDIFLTLNNY